MDNIAIIGVIILIMWLAVIGYYFIVSRQQKTLANEIEELRNLLDAGEDDINED